MYWSTWGTCGTCGFAVPSAFLILTRKRGWQCLPGSGRTRGCYDGNYDRDDIYYVYPDNEGTRETAAPLADPNAGSPIYVFVFRDVVTGFLYSADFNAATLTLTLVSEVDEDTQFGPFDWLEANNGQRIYVAHGSFFAGSVSPVFCPAAATANQDVPSFSPAPGNVDVVPVGGTPQTPGGPGGGEIIYTPPGGEPTPINPPAIELECPAAVVDGLGVDLSEPPPALPFGVMVTNYHWEFDDGNSIDTGPVNTVHHDYASSAIYDVIVTVTASNGGVGTTGACPVEVCPAIECFDIPSPAVMDPTGGPNGEPAVVWTNDTVASVTLTGACDCAKSSITASVDGWLLYGALVYSCVANPGSAAFGFSGEVNIYTDPFCQNLESTVTFLSTDAGGGGTPPSYHRMDHTFKTTIAAGRTAVLTITLLASQEAPVRQQLTATYLSFSATEPTPWNNDQVIGVCSV
jgi:hypothetical protein